MAFSYRPRSPRASPLWQCLHDCLDDFLAAYPERHAPTLGPLRPELEETFRHRVLQRLRDEGWISQRQVKKLLSWRHSGFNIDPGETAIPGDDPKALQRLAEYLLRAPLSLEKMSWNAETRTVLYRSHKNWNTKRNFEVFAGPDFIAALSEHVPPKNFQTIRYYGFYSNKTRGMRRKDPGQSKNINIFSNKERPRRPRKRQWRQRILDIWGCDPLKCPCCGKTMHPTETVETEEAIRAVLEPLGLWIPPTPMNVRAPRAPPTNVRWMVDALDGQVIDLETERDPKYMPTARRYPWPKVRFRTQERTPEPQQNAPEPAPTIQQLDNGLILEIENPDPWANDNEPIFWTD